MVARPRPRLADGDLRDRISDLRTRPAMSCDSAEKRIAGDSSQRRNFPIPIFQRRQILTFNRSGARAYTHTHTYTQLRNVKK